MRNLGQDKVKAMAEQDKWKCLVCDSAPLLCVAGDASHVRRMLEETEETAETAGMVEGASGPVGTATGEHGGGEDPPPKGWSGSKYKYVYKIKGNPGRFT